MNCRPALSLWRAREIWKSRNGFDPSRDRYGTAGQSKTRSTRVVPPHQYGEILTGYPELHRAFRDGAEAGVSGLLIFGWHDQGHDIAIYGTDPDAWDSTGDGLGDGEVVAVGWDPSASYAGIVGIVQDRPMGFDLYDEGTIHDLRMSDLMLNVGEAGSVELQFFIEEPTGLETGSLYEEVLREIVLSGDSLSLRVRAEAWDGEE